MRFVSRILLGVTAATLVAIGAPVAANATTTPASSAASSYDAAWGPYYSGDHKAKSYGHVSVEKKKFKFWYWKWITVKKEICWKDKDGDKHCKWVEKKVKKRFWEWRHDYFFTVHSTLHNAKWWGKKKCAWETFKVVNKDGSAYFKSFRNCSKHPQEFTFYGKNAAHIYVDVSRGTWHQPTGFHSGWEDVYHAAA